MRTMSFVRMAVLGVLLALSILSPATAHNPEPWLEGASVLTPTPPATPPAVPTPEPTLGADVACPPGLWISVDRGEGAIYRVCDPITICYGVPYPVYIRIWVITDEGSWVTLEGYDDGTGGCYRGVVGKPLGIHTLRIQMIENGCVTAEAETWFYVCEAKPLSVQIWTDRGEGSTYRIGDPMLLCYSVSRPAYVEIWKTTSAGSARLIAGYDDGTGDCLHATVGEPPGVHTYYIYGYDCPPSSPLASDQTWVNVEGVDNEGPSITDIEESNDPIYTQGCDFSLEDTPDKITISAKVNDPSGVAWVGIEYWESTGAWYNSQDMLKGFFDVYRAELGPYDDKQTIRYRIRARDTSGNETISPTYEFRVLYCCFSYSAKRDSVDFDPSTHGFKFENWGDYCLGMSLAAWDYWHYGREIPPQYNHWYTEYSKNELICYIIWRKATSWGEGVKKELTDRIKSEPDTIKRNRQEFERTLGSLKAGKPVLLVLAKGDKPSHAVLVSQGTYCPVSDTYELLLYDPNRVSKDTGATTARLGLTPVTAADGTLGFKFKYWGLSLKPFFLYYDELYDLSPPLHPKDPDAAPWPKVYEACDYTTKAMEDLEDKGYTATQLKGGTLQIGASETHSFYSPGGMPLAVSLHWGEGTFKFALYRPDGSLYEERQGGQPPLMIEVPNAETGEWTFKVTAVSVPSGGELYVALTGIKYYWIYLPFILKNR